MNLEQYDRFWLILTKLGQCRYLKVAELLRKCINREAKRMTITEIIISLRVEEYNPVKLFEEVLETPFKVEMERGNVYFIESYETDDPIYSSFISVTWEEHNLGLGKYANIKLADKLYCKKKINSAISHDGLIGNLDPLDPFWCILHENGKWYLGDTSDSLLECPYGNPGISKTAELDLKTLLADKYVRGLNI